MKNLDFEWLTDEFMLYCRSTHLREKTMSSYEQTNKAMKYFILGSECGIFLKATNGDIKEYRYVQALYHSAHC